MFIFQGRAAGVVAALCVASALVTAGSLRDSLGSEPPAVKPAIEVATNEGPTWPSRTLRTESAVGEPTAIKCLGETPARTRLMSQIIPLVRGTNCPQHEKRTPAASELEMMPPT